MKISLQGSPDSEAMPGPSSSQHFATSAAASAPLLAAAYSTAKASQCADRRQLLDLISAQKDKPTLQALENLARGDRQVGTLAAVLAAEADKHCESKNSRWRIPFLNRSVPEGFVETGIRSVIRQREVAAMTEPVFKSHDTSAILRAADRHPSETMTFATSTKSQMLVDRLLTACGDEGVDHLLSGSRNTPGLIVDLDRCLHKAGVAVAGVSCMPRAAAVGVTAQPVTASVLADIVTTRDPSTSHADFIRLLAGHVGEAAQFFNYVEHAMLIKNSANNTPCNRYEYTDDFGLLCEQIENKGEPWLETFLPGVERTLSAEAGSEGAWRILDNGQWRYPDAKREVLDHVFFSAMSHLFATKPTGPQMPVYPLVAYELLGGAIGKPVPDYLIAHEGDILKTLTKNASAAQARKTRQQEEMIRARESSVRVLESQQQRVRDNHVCSASQLYLCNNSYDRQKITERSVDRLLPLVPPDGERLALMRGIQDRLAITHDRQTISYVDHLSPTRDHLCWLRSAWLGLFCTQTPDQLAQRLKAICQSGSRALGNVPILAEIATRFHSAPADFMHNEVPGQELTDSFSQAARLGPPGPLEESIPAASRLAGSRLKPRNLEGWLKDLQCDIAANFRFENKAIMNEIEAVGFPGTLASSDMLICLHRAFQAPCLIVEAGLSETGGAQHSWSSVSAQLRVAAVEGTSLAKLLDVPAAETPEAALNRASMIFGEFTHLPVIWLEREHFEVYFPKSMTRNNLVGSLVG